MLSNNPPVINTLNIRQSTLSHSISKVKRRESNLELLRIISMMLVMLVHYIQISVVHTKADLISNPIRAISELELHSIAEICVHCFILISGYFGIRWRFKSFAGLIFQLVFWAILGYYIYEYLLEPFIGIEKDVTLRAFISSLFESYRGRWFVSAYVTLYILSPLINSFVEKVSEKKLLTFIGVFYLYSTIYSYLMLSDEFNVGLSALSMVGLYTLGAWLKRSKLRIVHCNKYYDLIGFLACTFIMTGGSAVLLLIGIGKSIYGYLNPIVIIESLFLFQFFRKIEVGHIGWINFLASSAFAAFLLHCHGLVGPVWNNICHHIHESNYALLYVFIFIAATFVIAVLIDKIRMFVWEFFYSGCTYCHNNISFNAKIRK